MAESVEREWFRIERFPFTGADLSNRVWSFGVPGREPHGRHLRLLPDGRIGGYLHENEKWWEIDGDTIVFRDMSGQVTSVFDRIHIDRMGRLRLLGQFMADATGGTSHMLEEISPIQGIAPSADAFPMDIRPGIRRRRNLVIMGVGENSLHTQWDRNVSDEDRNWDLCLSFYGDPANYPPPGQAEYTSLQPGVRKWIAIHRAMNADSPFWEYERVLVMDDDLMTTWLDINKLFNVARDYDLLLAQPALREGSHVTHEVTRQRFDTILRFTSFVEAMAPMFTRDAMRLCIPTAERMYFGWGIDHIWPKLLGEPVNRIGIIDSVAVTHTRPLGANYDTHGAWKEEQELLAFYGVTRRIEEFGAVYAERRWADT